MQATQVPPHLGVQPGRRDLLGQRRFRHAPRRVRRPRGTFAPGGRRPLPRRPLRAPPGPRGSAVVAATTRTPGVPLVPRTAPVRTVGGPESPALHALCRAAVLAAIAAALRARVVAPPATGPGTLVTAGLLVAPPLEPVGAPGIRLVARRPPGPLVGPPAEPPVARTCLRGPLASLRPLTPPTGRARTAPLPRPSAIATLGARRLTAAAVGPRAAPATLAVPPAAAWGAVAALPAVRPVRSATALGPVPVAAARPLPRTIEPPGPSPVAAAIRRAPAVTPVVPISATTLRTATIRALRTVGTSREAAVRPLPAIRSIRPAAAVLALRTTAALRPVPVATALWPGRAAPAAVLEPPLTTALPVTATRPATTGAVLAARAVPRASGATGTTRRRPLAVASAAARRPARRTVGRSAVRALLAAPAEPARAAVAVPAGAGARLTGSGVAAAHLAAAPAARCVATRSGPSVVVSTAAVAIISSRTVIAGTIRDTHR
ncbi:hypothetical protein [Pseudonocardia kunmingensis]|uniref:hypothetical protein n=1 Tax=Pseudonocardia kunmingensis TaxID=630975 RepID=UPI001150C5F7|nr:hypothetical protein [Pseudonocardia kunmingensis]